MNIKRINKQVLKTIESSDFTTKIRLSFSRKTVGEEFDPYEKNYNYSNLNPITIKGYVTEISPEALVYKQYGLVELGAKEVICQKKYAEWFRKCNKVEIDDDIYQVYKEAQGSRAIISELPCSLIRVIISKMK